MRELRRHNLARTFAHQFRVIAARSPSAAMPAWPARRQGGDGGVPWRFVRPRRVPGLAAVKHAEAVSRRQALTEAWLARRGLTRASGGKLVENTPVRPAARPERSGPMSRGELYQWHKAMGTLEVFFAMFPEI